MRLLLSISVKSWRKTRNSPSIIAKLRELTISVLFNNMQTASSVHMLNIIVTVHINFNSSPDLIPHKSLFAEFQIASCTVKVKSAEAVSCFRAGWVLPWVPCVSLRLHWQLVSPVGSLHSISVHNYHRLTVSPCDIEPTERGSFLETPSFPWCTIIKYDCLEKTFLSAEMNALIHWSIALYLSISEWASWGKLNSSSPAS